MREVYFTGENGDTLKMTLKGKIALSVHENEEGSVMGFGPVRVVSIIMMSKIMWQRNLWRVRLSWRV